MRIQTVGAASAAKSFQPQTQSRLKPLLQPLLQVRQLLQGLCLIFTLLFAATAPQAFADGNEPAVLATPVVNINSAGPAELSEVLVGVGLKKAEQIVQWREQNGPFKSIDELTQVKGIGPSTIEKNRPRIKL